MRLPGFLHRKGEPRLVRITGGSGAVYTSDQFPAAPKPNSDVPEHLKDYKSTGVGAESLIPPGPDRRRADRAARGQPHAGQVARIDTLGHRFDDRARLVRHRDQARLRAVLRRRIQGRRPRADDRGRSEKVNKPKRGARSQRRRDRAPRACCRLLEYDQQRKEAAEALGIRARQVLDAHGSAAARRERQRRRAPEAAQGRLAAHIGTKINADHALVLAGNKAAVMKFEERDQVSPAAGRRLQAVVRQPNRSRSARRSSRSATTGWATRNGGNMTASSSHRRDRRSARATTISGRVLPSSRRRATARSSWRT